MNSQEELKEATRRSIARLISIQRGAEDWNADDYTTAGNILIVCSRLIKSGVEAEASRRERAAEEHFIALICKDPNCSVAIVKLREEYDPPTATSMTLFCPKHDTEGDYPYYFDKDGEEVSGDPETFTKRQSLKEKEAK